MPNATPSDAELILKLYDMRREPEMRKARNWFFGFWPENVDEYMKVGTAMGAPENAWLRQVTSYWEMVAALVQHGAINRELFLEPSVCGEMILVFSKVQPILKDLREKMNSPTAFSNIEKLIMSTPESTQRFKAAQERFQNVRKQMKASGK